jgi:tetratricopeptide (TPR) repeat protein
MHIAPTAGYDPLAYASSQVVLLPLGIPEAIGNVLVPAVGIAYLAATGGAALQLLRRGSPRDLLPAGMLALTQALWFSGPFGIRYLGWHTGLAPIDQAFATRDYVLWTFVGHGIQYLWVTTYYARAAQSWHGYGNYLFKAAAAGIAIWTLPFVVFAPGRFGTLAVDSGLALVVAAGVNLHHFILDGAIWKLRNTRIASVLIRNQESHAEAPANGRGWLRPAVWALAIAGLAIGVFEFQQTNIALPRAFAAKDWNGADATLDRLAWVGYDRAQRRYSLGRAYDRSGDLEAAAAQYQRSRELRRTPDALALLGWTEERLGRHASAAAAYREALALDVPRADMFHAGLARLAHAQGRDAEAIERYREALRMRPGAQGYENSLAWILATSPDAGLRDPLESIRIAEGLLGRLEQRDPKVLDTLAAGYAAAGRFDDAVVTANEAVALASSAGDTELRQRVEAKLALYRANQAFVESVALRDG